MQTEIFRAKWWMEVTNPPNIDMNRVIVMTSYSYVLWLDAILWRGAFFVYC